MDDDFVGDFSITFRTLASDTAWKVVSEQGTSGKTILGSSIVMLSNTLMTSQGSDTVTSIFKCYSSNTIKSLRLLKIA